MNLPSFRILEEGAASIDSFYEKTHEKLADALYKIVSDKSKKGTTIGLEGSWGSGKSSIINILKEKLKESKNIKYFFFDAWAHTGDPLRRIFLETLINQLGNNNPELLKIKETISQRTKYSTTHTEQLVTGLGKFLSLSAIFVPFGVVWASAQLETKVLIFNLKYEVDWALFLSIILTVSPLFVILLRLLILTCKKFIIHENILIFSNKNWMFLQSDSSQTINQITSENFEQSSIEFEKYFDIVISEIFKNNVDKIVIVIDNLDRVDSNEAYNIWVTLQTFLQTRNPTGNLKKDYQRLYFIIPYDINGLSRLWDHSNDKNLSASFFDKFFQLRFEVPNLILSNWENYCGVCCNSALINWSQKDKTIVVDILKKTRNNVNDSPSPRQIKTYINQVAIITIYGNNGYNLEAICYYVILKQFYNYNSEKIKEYLLNGNIPLSGHDVLLPDSIREDLCGLIYGVSPATGIQILLEPEIQTALFNNDQEKLFNLIDSYSTAFWIVFDMHIQKVVDYYHLKIYATTISRKLYSVEKDNLKVFVRNLNIQSKKWSNSNFPIETEDAKNTYSLLSLLDDSGENVFIVWKMIMISLEERILNKEYDPEIFGKNLEIISKGFQINKINPTILNKLGVDDWLFWLSTNSNYVLTHIRPKASIVTEVANKIQVGLPISDELGRFINFLRANGIENTAEITHSLIMYIKANGSNLATTLCDENAFKLIGDIIYYQYEMFEQLFQSYEIYNLSSVLGMNKYVALYLFLLYEDKFDSIQIPHQQQSPVGYKKAIEFWKNENPSNANFILDYVRKYNLFGKIWKICKSEYILPKTIIDICVENKEDKLFLTHSNMEIIKKCLIYYDLKSSEISYVASVVNSNELFIEKYELNQINIEEINEIYVIVFNNPADNVRRIIETAFSKTERRVFEIGFRDENKFLEIIIELSKRNNNFHLGHDYCEVLIQLLGNWVSSNESITTWVLFYIEEILNAMKNSFREHLSRQIGVIISKKNYEIIYDNYKQIKKYIDFRGVIETHINNFETGLDMFIGNPNHSKLSLLNDVIGQNIATFNPNSRYQSILFQPLTSLFAISDENQKDEIQKIANSFKINLQSYND